AGAQVPCGLVARLGWRRAIDGVGRGALAVAEPAGPDDALALELALAGAALERAADRAEHQGPAAARRDLADYVEALAGSPRGDGRILGAVGAPLTDAARAFGDAANGGDGARALKLARELARGLSR